ncbi:MAG TPA: sugar transferase [Bdellovibrionota bacterium]|nr:sugar transferase [Bdellovibrionota bacterium]
MFYQQAKEKIYLVALEDAILLCTAFALSFILRSSLLPLISFLPPLELASHLWLLFLALPLFGVFGSKCGLYQISSFHSVTIIWRVFKTTFYAGLFLGTAIFFFKAETVSRAIFLLFLFNSFLFLSMARIFHHYLALRGRDPLISKKQVLIVGISQEAFSIHTALKSQPGQYLQVVGHLLGPGETRPSNFPAEILGSITDLQTLVARHVVDEIIFAIPVSDLQKCEKMITWCEEVGLTVHMKLDIVRTLFAKTFASDFYGMPILTISPTPRDAIALLIKRVVDIFIAAITLILLSPLLVLITIAIRLSSPGPILFRQQRVGLNGRLFTFYKFRSMYEDAEERKPSLTHLNEVSGPVFKIKNDPRVTPVGRWLRKFSLDELPQLWNVFLGDMSLVGPRPPVPGEVKQYEWRQRRRLSMKPGITCLWQIKGRSNIPFEEWMRLDLAYIDNWSLKLDLKILLKTIPAVLLARGAH